MMHICVLILSVVYISLACSAGFCNSEKTDRFRLCKPCPEQNGTRDSIPAYILYILGFISILLVLVSIFLTYVLVKTKFLQTFYTSNRDRNTLVPENFENRCPQSHTYQMKTEGATNLEKTTTEFKKENENIQTLKTQDSEVNIASEYNTRQIPEIPQASGNISPRIIRGVAKDNPIILPEQMSLICKEVLNRTAKHGPTSSLQNLDHIVKEGKQLAETMSECGSTQALDLYDKPRTLYCDEKNRKEDDAVNKNSQSLSIISVDGKSETGCETYDCPRTQDNTQDGIYDLPKELTDKVDQSGYIMPYFSANPSSSETFMAKEKLDYAQVKGLSSTETASKNEFKNAEKEENEYEFPKKNDCQNQIYINANEVTTNDIKDF